MKLPRLLSLFLLLPLGGCILAQGQPKVASSMWLSNMYVFRGVPMVDAMVLQGDGTVSIPTAGGDTLAGKTWVNINLEDDSDDALLPEDHERQISEIDLALDYIHEFNGGSISVGVASYNYPNVLRTSTTELCGRMAWDGILRPEVALFWDVDEFDSYYLNGGVSHVLELGSDLDLELGMSLGWMDGGMSEGYYGVDESGLADLGGSGVLVMTVDEESSFSLGLFFSSVIDDDLSDALDASGIDDQNVWLMFGITWTP